MVQGKLSVMADEATGGRAKTVPNLMLVLPIVRLKGITEVKGKAYRNNMGDKISGHQALLIEPRNDQKEPQALSEACFQTRKRKRSPIQGKWLQVTKTQKAQHEGITDPAKLPPQRRMT